MLNIKNCPLRHQNGNCLAVGGFCTAVSDEICYGLLNAYDHGKNDALELLKGQNIPRCRECKHWQKADRPYVGDEFPDTGYCGLFEREYLATDFCSYHTDAYWGWADERTVKWDE